MLRWLAVLSALLIWASHTLAYGATFDLAILGQGYTDRVKFEADAQRAYQALVSYAPFSEFAGQFQWMPIWNTTNLGCTYNGRLLTCSTTAVRTALLASGIPFDKAIVLVNNGTYGGSGGTYAVSYNGSLMPGVIVHEFGHSLAGLHDEYVLYVGNPGTAGTTVRNCYVGSASAWPYLGCRYSGWKRSTSCSIMRSLNCPYFNTVSQALLRQVLVAFTQ